MNQVIKVRCNSSMQHVNDVDLDDVLIETTTLRAVDFTPADVPERLVLRCRECADGKVIVTRAMIQDARERNS